MTENAILTFVYDRRRRSNNTTEGVIELRVYLDRKQKYITTGVKVLPKHWKNGLVVNRLDAGEINVQLDKVKVRVRRILNEMAEKGELSLNSLQDRIVEQTRVKETFIEYAEKRAEERSFGKREGTKKHYDTFLAWFKKWGKIQLFSDVTATNIMRMDADLHQTGMKDVSIYSNYHKFLKSFVIDAAADGLIKGNPYQKLNISRGSEGNIQRFLLPEEFRKIERCQPATESLCRVKDLFIFQTYTCLSYIDLVAFDFNTVKNFHGTKIYSGKRVKTGVEFSFVLLKPAIDILKKYDYKLPIICGEDYNRYLKIIAATAGIDKPISSHWARHTGATLLLNDGSVPIKIISRILGHSTTRETEKIYAKLLDSTIVEVMNNYDARMAANKK